MKAGATGAAFAATVVMSQSAKLPNDPVAERAAALFSAETKVAKQRDHLAAAEAALEADPENAALRLRRDRQLAHLRGAEQVLAALAKG